MNRIEILAEASRLTGSDRNKEYGEPKDNLDATALLWSAYLKAKYGGKLPGTNVPEDSLSMFELTAEDVAWLNVLQKISRQFFGANKPDTFIDAAAYAAIAGEVSE